MSCGGVVATAPCGATARTSLAMTCTQGVHACLGSVPSPSMHVPCTLHCAVQHHLPTGLSAKDTKAWMGGTAAIRQEIEAKYAHNAPLASLQGKDDQADAPEPTSPNKWDARVEAAKEFASSVDSGASGPKQPSPVRSPGRSSSVRRARLAPSEVPPECLSAKDTIAWVSGNAAKREQIEKKYEAIMAARS